VRLGQTAARGLPQPSHCAAHYFTAPTSAAMSDDIDRTLPGFFSSLCGDLVARRKVLALCVKLSDNFS